MNPLLPTLAGTPATSPPASSPVRDDDTATTPAFSRVLANRQTEHAADEVPATDEPAALPGSDDDCSEADPATADSDQPDDDAPPEATLVTLTLDLARQHLQPQRDGQTAAAAADRRAAHASTAVSARRLPAATRPDPATQAAAGAREPRHAAARSDASAAGEADAAADTTLNYAIRTALPDAAWSATLPQRPAVHQSAVTSRPALRRDATSVPAAGRLPTQPDTTLQVDTITTSAAMSVHMSVQPAATHDSDLPHPGGSDTATLPDALAQVATPLLPVSAGFDTAATTVALNMTTPLAAPQWPQELGRHLVTLASRANGDTQHAELRLDPPELGPLRITLTLNDGLAHASFVSPHASVRLAVEAALAHLQANLAEAGISLGQTSVNDQSEQSPAAFDTTSQFTTSQTTSAPAANAASATPPRRDHALLDLYA